MSIKKSSPERASGMSTRVRLGVVVVVACFVAAPAFSNPVNPKVVIGTASFSQTANVLTVTNSNGAIISWDKFSIKAGETTHFAQTAASSTVLNRVLSDPTAIYGTLSSNGRVWLVNPAGILVGSGGRIDTAGFVASTLSIRNEDFLAGRHLFVNDGNAQSVINQGEIRTPAGGSVYLIGSNVGNDGIINTPKGETILAAGATVSLIDSATPGVKVDITGAQGNATNLGQITAEAGRIGIAGVIVRNSGQLNASSVVSDGGRIFLKASQDAYVDKAGRIVTTGTRGGSVEVLGNRVAVLDDASVDASGENGGGRILVGGDYQGKNPNIRNANITYFGPNASLKADATEIGDGGKVIVWADDTTRAYGSISARGGTSGGNGGFIETSGKQYLDVAGINVSTAAPNGDAGNWLLDPTDITIIHSAGYGGATFLGNMFDNGGAATATLTDFDINTNLAGSDIVITTNSYGGNIGDIKFDASGGAMVISNGSGPRNLTFTANRDIIFTGGSTTFTAGTNSPLDIGFNPGAGRKVEIQTSASAIFDGTDSGSPVRAAIKGASGKSWENFGTVTLSGTSYIDLNRDAGITSAFSNNAGAVLNLGSNQGFAIQSEPVNQAELISNAGMINVTAGTSIEAAYSQTSTGQLTVGDGQILNLQNAIALSGNVNLNSSGTLNINENHGTPANLTNLTFSGSGGDLRVDSAMGGPKIVNFTNVAAGNVDLYVGTGTVNVLNGNAVFKSLAMDGGTLGAISNGALGIASGDFTIPNGVTYSGNVSYFAEGDLSVENSMTVPGALKLMAGWNGSIATPATISEMGTVRIWGFSSGPTAVTAGTIAIEAGLGVDLVDDGDTVALLSTPGHTSIRAGSGGLGMSAGTSITSSGFVELSPSGNASSPGELHMCITDIGNCPSIFNLDPSILSQVHPAGVLILGRPVADTSYTGKLMVLSDIPSSVIDDGSWLALNGYDVVIDAAANIGTAGVAFDKPLDILANRNLTVTGGIVLGSTRDLVMNAGQSVNGLLNMNNGAAPVYAGNITLNNPRGAITGMSIMGTPSSGVLAANAYGGISLMGDNQVGTFVASNSGADNIEFFNTGDFNLGTVTNSVNGGSISIRSDNSISQISNITTNAGDISVIAGNDLTMTLGTKAESFGGDIVYDTINGHNIQLGLLDAVAGDVQVSAGESITSNGAPINIKAYAATLEAGYADSGLPKSIIVNTQVSILNVDNTYWGSGSASTIDVHNSGSALAVNVYSDSATGQLTITNDNTINVGHIGGANNATLRATGATADITIAEGTGGMNTLLADGNIVVEAGRDILVMHDYMDAGGTVTATAGRDIRLSSDGTGPFLAAESYIQAANGINLTAQTGGVYIEGSPDYAAYISTNAGDINIVTSTGFNNSDVLGNGAKGVLDAPLGRWLIYAPNPSTVVGAPAYNFKQYNTAHGGAIEGTGNGVIYTLAPTISASLAGTVSKVYDGTNLAALTAANYGGLIGMVDGDIVEVLGNPAAGTYDTKDVGGDKTVTVGGLSIAATNTTAAAYGGSAQVYGYTFDGTASGVIGAITPRSLNLGGLTAQNKIYDGNTDATLTGSLGGLITGDIVGIAPGSATFADRHVGTAKTVSIANLALSGKDAGNYTLVGTATSTTANIAQRASVNWVGGVDTNWSTAANWAGGALPDRANVAAVTLGSGAVSYDYSNAPADAPLLGSLNLAGGTLTLINGTLTVPTWLQTAGNLRGAGGLTVSQSMVMNGLGTIDIGGPVTISHTGNLQLGRIRTADALSVTATGALSATNAAGSWVQTAGSIVLDAFGIGAASDMLQTRTQSLAITNRGGNAWIHNTGRVNVTGSSVGGLHLESLGGIVTGSSKVTAVGKLDLIAHSPLVIGSGGVTGGAGVVLRASTPDASNSSILISGPVSAPGGSVVVAAYNDVTQNANITGNSVNVGSDSGSIQMAATAQTQATGGNVSYKAPAGNMMLASINSGSGSVSLDAGGSIAPAPGLTGTNITGASATINAGGSLELSTSVTRLEVDVGGNFAVSNGGTVFSSTPASASGVDQASKDLTNATDRALTDKTPTERSEAPPPPDTSKTDTSKPFSDPGKTTGGTEGTFGSEGDKPSTEIRNDEGGTKTVSTKDENGKDKKDEKDEKDKKDQKSDEAKDEKKDDKPVAKKVAQCT